MSNLLSECTHMCVAPAPVLDWVVSQFSDQGYTQVAIEIVKQFDAYLAGDCPCGFLSALGLPYDSNTADPDHIRAVRQLLRLGWKMESNVSNECNTAAKLAACRRLAVSGRHDRDSIYFMRAKRRIHQLFKNIPIPSIDSINLSIGPGTTCEGYKTIYHKVAHLQWSPRWSKFARISDLSANDNYTDQLVIRTLRVPITKLCLVPKDVRGPRIISEEPNTSMMFQQGLWKYIEKQLRHIPSIQFRSQEDHRALLRDRSFSSLDLSDASDYVSRRLVWNLFPRKWAELLFTFRSVFISDQGVLYPIRAFAPMGSALCFPIEAIVHWAAVEAAQQDIPRGVRKKFSVYGDDIIVDSVIAGSVMSSLRALGLSPNIRKCYINRAFRESCGLDLFLKDGKDFDVTPTYVRSPLRKHSNEKDVMQVALVQNHLFLRGYNDAADLLKGYCAARLGLPWVRFPIPGAACLLTLNDERFRVRHSVKHQVRQIRTIVLKPKHYNHILTDGEAAFAVYILGKECDNSISSFVSAKWCWTNWS